MAENIHKKDEKTVIYIDVGVDASEITIAKIYYQKPSGNCGYWDATPIIGTTKIKYVTQTNDIDEEKTWYLQPYLELISGWKGHGDIIRMKVSKIICDN